MSYHTTDDLLKIVKDREHKWRGIPGADNISLGVGGLNEYPSIIVYIHKSINSAIKRQLHQIFGDYPLEFRFVGEVKPC